MKKYLFTIVLGISFSTLASAQVSVPGGNTAIQNSNPTPSGLLNLNGSSWYQAYPTLRLESTGNEPGLSYNPSTNFVEYKLNRIPWLGGSPVTDNTFLINNYGDAGFGMAPMNYTRLSVKGNLFVGNNTTSGVRFMENRFTFANGFTNDYLFQATTDFFNATPVDILRLRANNKSTFYGQLGVGVDPVFFGLEVNQDAGVRGRLKVGIDPNNSSTWFPNSFTAGDFRIWNTNGSSGEQRAVYGESNAGKEGNAIAIGVEGVAYASCKDIEEYHAYGVKGTATNANESFGVYGSAPSDAEVCNGGRVSYAVYGHGQDIGFGTYYAGYFNGDFTYTGTMNPGSDRKLKKDIKPLLITNDLLQKLRPVEYLFRNGESEFEGMQLAKGLQFGFIAQEVETVFPNLVRDAVHPSLLNAENEVIRGAIDYKTVNYIGLIPILTSALQEQHSVIAYQNQVIDTLQKEIHEIRQLLEQIMINDRKQTLESTNDNRNFRIGNPYPNPSTGEIHFPLEVGGAVGISKFVVKDNTGKIVYQSSISESQISSKVFRADLSFLSSGTYMAYLQSENEMSPMSKFIISR